MSINSKQKGDRGERELAGFLTEKLGQVIQRKLGQPRDGGRDFELPGGWALEAKRANKPQINKWWLQALKQANGDKPVLAYRVDYQDWRFVVRLSDIRDTFSPQDWVMAELCIDGFCSLVRESM